jgi:5-methyltetrahydrofolate--homocysteine methyltransferase
MLDRLLATRDVLLADGATGTNLFERGLVSGEAPEIWNDLHPERIRDLHRAFVEAGADILLTNSFGANRRRLMLHQLEAQTHALNRRAAELARAEADAAGRPVVVAGSVGPTGDLLAPLGPLTEDDAVEVFAEQIGGLKAGGADVVWIETMSALDEIRAACRAAAHHAMPFAVTASFDTAGHTMMGVAPAALASFAAALDPAPCAIGANCGVGASDLVAATLAMDAAGTGAVLIAKANCGIPRVTADGTIYSGTPELMAAYARLAVDAGARIVGGCCGTSPAHLAAMRAAIDGHVRRPRPDHDLLVTMLGAFVAPPATAGRDAAARRSGRRRG